MEFKSESLTINLENNSLIFLGLMDFSEYKEIREFLKKVENVIENEEININFKNLKFINSSGIKTLASFIFETKKYVNFLIDESKTWQKFGLLPLTKLKKTGQVNILSS